MIITEEAHKIINPLMEAFDEPDGAIQEQACLKAIKDIMDLQSQACLSCNFLMELRDFLLEYATPL